MKLVYIAGPYAAPTHAEREANVHRAIALGRLALYRGLTPIVPHAAGWLGLFGAPDESEPGTRGAAIRHGCELAAMVAERGGEMWVITRDDYSLSAGVAREESIYLHACAASGRLTGLPWKDWRQRLEYVGMWAHVTAGIPVDPKPQAPRDLIAPHPGDPEARVVVQPREARVAEAAHADAKVERLSGLHSELSTTPATVEQFISRLTPWAEIEQLCELSTTPTPDSLRGAW